MCILQSLVLGLLGLDHRVGKPLVILLLLHSLGGLQARPLECLEGSLALVELLIEGVLLAHGHFVVHFGFGLRYHGQGVRLFKLQPQ